MFMAAIQAQKLAKARGKKIKPNTSPFDRKSENYKPVYTEQQIKLVLKLREEGMKLKAVADMLGFKPHTVKNLYARYHLVSGRLEKKQW
jgi:DNA invertase Pin-like site-specific DNA recombinase